MSEFGKLLKRFREEAKLSQAILAEIAGVHPSHLSRIERGLRHPKRETVGLIANALRLGPNRTAEMFLSAGYSVVRKPSNRVNVSGLAYSSPVGVTDLNTTRTNEQLEFLSEVYGNKTLKVIAGILQDDSIPKRKRKLIESKILSFAQWLRDDMKKNQHSKGVEGFGQP